MDFQNNIFYSYLKNNSLKLYYELIIEHPSIIQCIKPVKIDEYLNELRYL